MTGIEVMRPTDFDSTAGSANERVERALRNVNDVAVLRGYEIALLIGQAGRSSVDTE